MARDGSRRRDTSVSLIGIKLQKHLFVAMYEDMNGSREGNQMLLEAGGMPLRRSRSTDHAQLREVFAVLGIDDEHRRVG
jgi:hypothetical protein